MNEDAQPFLLGESASSYGNFRSIFVICVGPGGRECEYKKGMEKYRVELSTLNCRMNENKDKN